MSLPTSRSTFKQYCLRKLGEPVIRINIDDTQVEDAISEALQKYWDYHFDGSEKVYYKVDVTPTILADKYITLPDNIIGTVQIFPLSRVYQSSDVFSVRYQVALHTLFSLTTTSLVPLYMTMMHLRLLEEMLVGMTPIRYNRHANRLYLDLDWRQLNEGDILVIEAYRVVDPTVFPDVWKDVWLIRYATALIKERWGANLKKYSGLQMPGGVTFNGQQIYDEAKQEIAALEEELYKSWSLPASDMIG